MTIFQIHYVLCGKYINIIVYNGNFLYIFQTCVPSPSRIQTSLPQYEYGLLTVYRTRNVEGQNVESINVD